MYFFKKSLVFIYLDYLFFGFYNEKFLHTEIQQNLI